MTDAQSKIEFTPDFIAELRKEHLLPERRERIVAAILASMVPSAFTLTDEEIVSRAVELADLLIAKLDEAESG